MKVKIEIECDSIVELVNHLSVIRAQVIKEKKKQNLSVDDEFPKRVVLSDNNCYGTHEVKINK